ncbi:cell division protein FtsW [Alkalicaulis satelles]|uniref:Probable peptidoglycan glycosyltransferase FtsW n=1 Tax=Alkalicaulis satelles TaxID=2609175 RepID=A0A5M6ZSJ1_9PROT|nr:FtsW/RodA/SpoVE family cell cycle protein [Alkalicaulis satelles]KAA5805291.1 cell division protein FtsW [Alkalicaulis satelles]
MSPARRYSRVLRELDKPLLGMIIFLLGMGLVLSFAASPAVSSAADPFFYVRRQAMFMAAGLIILMISASFSLTGVRRMSGLMLLGSLVLMAAVLVFGANVNGSTRWLHLGGFSLQPSEFFKPAFIIITAWLFTEEDRGAPAPGRLMALVIYALAVLLLTRQPDLGQTALITLIFAALLWIAGLSWRWTAGLGAAIAAGGAAAMHLVPYIQRRVQDFLSGGSGARSQTDIALEAIGHGGLWGAGPGEGRIKHILPEAHNDYIFAVAGEEFGALAMLMIIALYALLFARAWMLALRLNDPFARLATAGLALLFALQALVNIAVNLDLAPSTGMTLPFLSYGGSSMLALAFSAGLLLALTRHRPGAYQPRRLRAAGAGA